MPIGSRAVTFSGFPAKRSPDQYPLDRGFTSAHWQEGGPGGRELVPPPPVAPDRGFLLIAEPAAASPVVEEHEEHDQVDDRGGGQVDGQPLLPLAAVSGFCLSHCPLLRSYRIALPVLRTGD